MGYGNFDHDAVKKHNVTLTNTVYGAQTIAQFTMALLLDICHDIRGNSDFIKKLLIMYFQAVLFLILLTGRLNYTAKHLALSDWDT